MSFSSWRGLVGSIRPNLGAGSTEDQIKLAPDGVGFIPVFMDLPHVRGPARLEAAKVRYEEKVRELSELDVDLIQAEGSAYFMKAGPKGELDIIRPLEKKYRTTVISQGMSLTAAMRAMKMKRIVAVRPFTWSDGADFTGQYLADAGFELLTVESPEGYDVRTVREIHPHAVYQACRKAVRAHPKADGICLVASVMRVGDIIQVIEDDLGIPVVSNLTARAWEIQKHLDIRQPFPGYGRLLADLP